MLKGILRCLEDPGYVRCVLAVCEMPGPMLRMHVLYLASSTLTSCFSDMASRDKSSVWKHEHLGSPKLQCSELLLQMRLSELQLQCVLRL